MARLTTCTDEEFNLYKRNWTDTLHSIQLPQDMNPATGVVVLSQLDEAYAKLRIDYAELEAAKDKAESIIRQKERVMAVGSNEDNRKKNASEYLEAYPINEEDTINMYEWSRMLGGRFSVLRSFIDVINNKQHRLITMTGLAKIDSNLGSGAH